MSTEGQNEGSELNRRKLLSGLSAAAAMGLAGCGGGGTDQTPTEGGGGSPSPSGDQQQQDLGERVEKLVINYYSGLAYLENVAPVLRDNLKNRLGLNVEAGPLEILTLVGHMYRDAPRDTQIPLYVITSEAAPHQSTHRFSIQNAGSWNAGTNVMQMPDCEYSISAHAQSQIVDQEKRRQTIYNAHSRMSELGGPIPISPQAVITAIRTDQAKPGPHDVQGTSMNSPETWTNAETVGDTETIKTGDPTTLFYETTNFFTVPNQKGPWNNLVHSPLRYHTPEYEMKKDLASSIEIENEGKRVVVEVKDGATFHNGDPVTSADVKFTYNLLRNNTDVYPFAPPLSPLNEIVEVDEKTAAFNFEVPHLPLVSRNFPTWGILHRKTWVEAGALEDASSVKIDNMIGSGPYEVENFVPSRSLSLTPYKDHHTFDPQAPISISVMRDQTATFQSLRSGSIGWTGVTPQQAQRLEGNDKYQIVEGDHIMNWSIIPQFSFGPTMFQEFREAVSLAIDRQLASEVTTLGRVPPETHKTWYAKSHPWRAPEDMLVPVADDVTGNPQKAKQVLRDAGWGWDDNGNLRYPADYDLTPRWPKGKGPDPEDYPCLNSDNDFVFPEGYEEVLPEGVTVETQQ